MDRERQIIDSYLRIFALVLLGVFFLPFDFYGDQPVWPWLGILDGTWTDVTALLMPVGLAVSFWLLARAGWEKLSLSAALMGLWLLGLWVMISADLGAHSLHVFAHLTDGLPPLFARTFGLLLFGIVLLAAGIRLGASGFLGANGEGSPLADPWPVARVWTALGMGLVVLFYLLPYRGSVPLLQLLTSIWASSSMLATAGTPALLAGQILAMGPFFFVLAAGPRLWRRAPDHGGVLFVLLLAFVPALSVLVGIRNFNVLFSYTLLHLRASALILAFALGFSLALPALWRGAWNEVPWTFGRFTSLDRLLTIALRESSDKLGRGLPSLIRWLLRRRLRLWREAAGLAAAEKSQLLPVMHFLTECWQEERAQGQRLPSRPGWWLRGHWLSLALVAALSVLAGLTALAGLREDSERSCSLGPGSAAIETIFTELIPLAIVEKNKAPAHSALATLTEALDGVQVDHPGLKERVLAVLRLGAKGRRRLHSLWRARDRLNLYLHRQHLPYFVRSRVRSAGPGRDDLFYLLTYRVENCFRYRELGGPKSFSVLQLQRADSLNVIEQYVGATAEEEPFVSILMDRVDAFIRGRLVAVAEWGDAAGQLVRDGVHAAGADLSQLAEGVDGRLGQLVVEGLARHELHHKWLGLEPDPPTALWTWMSGHSDESVRAVSSEVGAFLGELAYRPAYARLRLAVILVALASEEGQRGPHGFARSFILARLFRVELPKPGPRLKISKPLFSLSLAALSDEELSLRIDVLHQELFGVPVPRFVRVE